MGEREREGQGMEKKHRQGNYPITIKTFYDPKSSV